MNIAPSIPDFDAPVVEHARKDFPLLEADMTVGDALERIRREGVGERVIYFYAVDEDDRLVGVVPTRRLLTAPLEAPLREIMVRRVVAIPANATILEACEFFVRGARFSHRTNSRRITVAQFPVSFSVAACHGDRRHALGDFGRLF